MNLNKIRRNRIPVELRQLQTTEATHGITCYASSTAPDDYTQLLANLPGPKGSPYEGATYELSIAIGDQYPFRPPTFKFATPVYHPNIDNSGNICLDLLRMPPVGSYNPAITLESILLSIQLLLATPNPDDPLNGEAADLYKCNREEYLKQVRQHVQKQKGRARKTKPTETEDAPTEVKRSKLRAMK